MMYELVSAQICHFPIRVPSAGGRDAVTPWQAAAYLSTEAKAVEAESPSSTPRPTTGYLGLTL